MLDVRNCSVRFGGVQAALGVSISVKEWEIVGVIGPNGAGKTTTFNMISGFTRPDEGEVWFRGCDVTSLAVHERAALGIGRTFQNVGLIKSRTVLDNMRTAQHLAAGYSLAASMVGAPAVRTTERQLDRRAQLILDLLGLGHLAGASVGGLPYGDLKRVELAAVLATDPELLLLDEPSSGMGPEEADALGDVLLELRRELGLTIAMIEHHVPLVLATCDYVYCLNFGQVLAEGTPEHVRPHPEVARAYLGEEPAAAHGGTVTAR